MTKGESKLLWASRWATTTATEKWISISQISQMTTTLCIATTVMAIFPMLPLERELQPLLFHFWAGELDFWITTTTAGRTFLWRTGTHTREWTSRTGERPGPSGRCSSEIWMERNFKKFRPQPEAVWPPY